MKLLLDTHIWIWSMVDPGRLGRSVAKLLGAPASEIWLSPVSIWELVLLLEKGRLAGPQSVLAWVEHARTLVRWHEASFNEAVVFEAASLRLAHRDPGDRLLVATARWYGLTLVTADPRLLALNACALLANR